MLFQHTPASRLCSVFIALFAPVLLTAQTTINVNSSVIQPTVKRFGINLGSQTFYDSGQMLKNLVFTNPSFEGEIYQSTVRCFSGTANSCVDENIYSGWPTSFWRNASYEMITGTSVGRSGLICSYTGANYPNSGGTFSFCDSGTAPAQGDYMVVKMTMSPNVGWPGGDWQTIVGNGALTAETTDLPPGTTGKQSALLTAPTAADSIGLNMYFDTTLGKTFLQLNGSYQLTFKAKGVSGSQALAVSLTRATAGLTYINQTVPLTNSWAPYTINFNGSENGTAIGLVELSFTTVGGADTVELDDVSVVKTNTDPTNTTVFRDEVVNTLQAMHPGVLRLWDDQLGESLDNLLASPTGRQRSAYTPYNGFDGTDVNFQNQSVEFGLTDFLQLCQKVGADPWIVVPSTFSTSEAYNLMDYLAGPSSTTYGGKRAAAGQAQPWTTVFKQIHLEFGNEEWNGGTFKGGALEYGDAYGGRATAIFTAMKGNSGYAPASFDLIVNGQSAAPYRNQNIQSYTLNNDSFAIAPYLMSNITSFDTIDHLFGTTFAEAEAYVTPNASAEGVNNGYILQEQQLTGKPIVTSEMNLGLSFGTISQLALNGYASSVGGGIAVLDSMFQQLRAGVLTQNLFELPGYISNTSTSPANTMYLWGAVLDMGVTNRVRPQYLALQLANSAIGNSTQMLQTAHTGADPTDTQYNYALNTVSLPVFHFLESFAFTGNGSTSLVVFNVNPDYSEQVNFAGPNAPTGTVVMQQLTSGSIMDTNEFSNVVATTSTTLSNFNASANMTLPPYSMTVFTWGGSVQGAPVISNVAATNVTSTSATITWTTDQASSSQVSYGTTTAYGSQTALNSTLTTSHSVVITGLTPGTTYDFAAISANSSSASTTSANSTFKTTSAAPVITAVTATAITSTSATITWTTDQAASSQVSYGTTTAYGTLSPVNSTLSTSHSVNISGLTPGTTYDFAAISANSANQSATSGNFTFATTATAPVISNVAATAITSSSATITWTTDQASSSQVSYGTTTSYGTLSPVNSTLSTSHSVNISGLTPGTTYDFAAISANSANVSATSANSTFKTTSVAPVISAVTATAITSTSATITWTTDQAASSQVSYGTTTAYGTLSTLNSTLSTAHSVNITGLTPGTTYDFAAISANSASQSTTSANFTFATSTVAPVISNVTSNSITSSSATITWTTDQASSSQVSYGTTTAYGTVSTPNSSLVTVHSVTLTGLTPGVTYDYAAISANASNQSTTSGNFTFTTTSVAPVISNVTATAITSTSATITWTTDQAASSIVSYGTTTAYGSQSVLNSTLTTAHSVTLTGLTAGTTYDFAATSANGANQSTTSANFTFTTNAAAAPIISAVTATGITTTSATITWTTNVGASSQVSYGATTAYGTLSSLSSTLVTSHSVTLTGLTPGTTYDYAAISAVSANASTTSANFTFTTTAVAPVISAVTASNVTTTSATITWTTDQASSSQVSYGTSSAYGSTSPLNSTLTTSHSVSLTGLTPGTTYDYAAISANSSSISATSANFTFTTTAAAAPPPVISNIQASALTTTSATITWTTDQASSSLVNYGISTAYGSQSALNSTLSTSHSVTLTGLTAGTTYAFDVVSANAASLSTTSANGTFSTPAANATPPYVGYVAFWGITTSSAVVSWSTDVPATAQLAYGTTPALGQLTPLQTPLTASHGATLTGLNPGTTYYFVAQSTGANGATGYSTTYSFTTLGTPTSAPGPVISAVTALSITNTSATITWTTDQASSSQVAYGATTSYGSSSAVNSALVTSHSVVLTGLTPGITYDFAAISANSSNVSTTSSNFTFATTSSTTTPPVISNIQTSALTSTSATITWTTDQASTSLVNYGTTTAYGSQSTLNTALTTSHSVTLTGLTAGVTYNFDVVSANSASLSTTSGNTTFSTPAANATPPYVGYVAFWGINNSGVTISWSTDVLANTQLAYGTTTALGQVTPVQTTLEVSHGVVLTGLNPGTTYYFVAQSTGTNGATGYSTTYSFTTTGTPVTTPAPVISTVTATNITGTSVTITWTTDQASTSQVNYGASTSYTASSTLNPNLVTSHSVTLTNLTAGTLYNFDVVSANSSAVSSNSANATFQTTGSTPTPVISAVTTSNVTSGTAVITWTTDQATSSLVNYGTTTGYGSSSAPSSTLVTSHSVTLSGLTPNTTYDFDVVSANAANISTTSPNSTFTTAAASATPPIVSDVAFWGVTSSSVVISWSTNEAASTSLAYGTTTALGQLTPVQTTLSATHGLTLTGLAPGTTYYFVAQSADANGNTGYSTTYTFTTISGAPTISSIVATPAAGNVATISAVTSAPTNTYVQYGTASGVYNRYSAETNLTSTPVCNLPYVPSGKIYYQVVSTSATGFQIVSPEGTFIEP